MVRAPDLDVETLMGAGPVVVVDAIRGPEPGRIVVWSLAEVAELPDAPTASTHGLPLPAVLKLAAALGGHPLRGSLRRHRRRAVHRRQPALGAGQGRPAAGRTGHRGRPSRGGRVMCLTALGTVVARDGDEAVVRTDDGTLRCSALIAPEALPGDDVLVGLGAILRRLTPDEATAIVRARTSDPEALLEVLS